MDTVLRDFAVFKNLSKHLTTMDTVLRDFCGLQKSKETSDYEGSTVCVISAGYAKITQILIMKSTILQLHKSIKMKKSR